MLRLTFGFFTWYIIENFLLIAFIKAMIPAMNFLCEQYRVHLFPFVKQQYSNFSAHFIKHSQSGLYQTTFLYFKAFAERTTLWIIKRWNLTLSLQSYSDFKMAPKLQYIGLLFFTWNLYYISTSASVSQSKYMYPQGNLACKTHNMTEMDCSNRYLVDIPFLDQDFATTLDLSHNQLKEIKESPFVQLSLLRTLNLSSNEISYLSSKAFRGLWFLEQLDLNRNQIQNLPTDVFFNLSKLEYLDLFDNWIPTIPHEAFGLKALHEIHWFGGNTFEIGRIGFKSNLTIFHIVSFLTSNVHNDTFQHFTNLPIKVFNVMVPNSHGNAYIIEKGAFLPLSKVIEVITMNNALPILGSLNSPLQKLTIRAYKMTLTATNKTTLQVLCKFNSTLVYLTIFDQPLLQRIEDDSFIWTPNLITLNLTNNQINFLAKYAFSGLNVLQELNLASNDLKMIPSDAFEVLRECTSFRYLDLSSNSFLRNIANEAFSVLSESLTMIKLSIKQSESHTSILTWLNKLPKLNHLLFESIGSKILLQDVPKSSLRVLVIINFNVYFSPCIAFPTLESLTMISNFIESFPEDLALHECSYQQELSLSHFESYVDSFDDKHLNITFPFFTHWR